jgi:hypothetical protein
MRGRHPRRLPVTLATRTDGQAEIARANRVVRWAWGDWLCAYVWSHFLTFSPPAGVTVADAVEMLKRGVRRLEGYTEHRVPWAASVERGRSGLVHVHVLLAGLERSTVREVEFPWRTMPTHCRVYNPAMGAAWYVCKEQVGADGVFERSKRFPPLLRRVA